MCCIKYHKYTENQLTVLNQHSTFRINKISFISSRQIMRNKIQRFTELFEPQARSNIRQWKNPTKESFHKADITIS